MNIKFEIPRIPKIDVKIPKVNISTPKINIPSNITLKRTSSLQTMDGGYKKGYDAGYSGSPDLSEGKDTASNDYWLGYGCGYRDGKFDRENGRIANC